VIGSALAVAGFHPGRVTTNGSDMPTALPQITMMTLLTAYTGITSEARK
jgi:hypothetical protein